MALIISQETFNDAVRENVNDLGMDLNEAIDEAVKQFVAQGVDLTNIVKEVINDPPNSDIINKCVQQLAYLNKNKEEPSHFTEPLSILKQECDKSIQHRVFAGKIGAYSELVNTLEIHKGNRDLEVDCLKTMIALMTKQPDLLDESGISLLVSYTDGNGEVELMKLSLKLARECCIMQEHNRQKLFEANILDNLKMLLERDNSDVLREVLALFRALILDDDVRVEFGKAHEHAKSIASATLCTLTNLMHKFQSNESLVNDLLLTISSLLVRHEFCKEVENAGGIDFLKAVMTEYLHSEKINKQCFKLIKALAGNDDCKVHMIKNGLAGNIIHSMDNHKDKPQTAVAGLACVAALTLRSTENSKTFFDYGAANIIVEIMKLHPDEEVLQKRGSWAIRNMVSRSKYQCQYFLELGAEEVLTKALENFSQSTFDIKAALRDLGCNVELKEEWTGKGGLLNSESQKN